MHFDGWSTLEGRHLVYVYAFVILAQGGYFAYVAANWFKLRRSATTEADLNAKKATRSF
jgi:hypothetical protein